MKPFNTTFYLCAVVFAVAVAAAFVHLDSLWQQRTDNFARWQRADPDSDARVDHRDWDALLSRYVVAGDDGVNRFKYASLTAADRARLDAYIAALESVTVTDLAGVAQLAYWINLYNAVTLRVILDHHPVASIRDINFSVADFGPWSEELTQVQGVDLSLDDIEHNIVRKIFPDNRIHYAFNCAAVGCPNLQARAFTRDNLETLLDTGAVEYINHPRGARVDGGRLVVSELYEWYADDFGGGDDEVIAHLKQFARAPLRQQLNGVTVVDEYFYDWSLNDFVE